MDFHRNNLKAVCLVSGLVACYWACGNLAAQTATPTAPAPGNTSGTTNPADDSAASKAPASAPVEDQPIGPRKGGIESSPISKGGSSGNLWSVLQTLLALAIVVALIFVAGWLLRRAGGRAGKADHEVMQVVARKAISARQQLLLVRLGGRLVLVGCSRDAMSPLCEISEPAEVAAIMERLQAGEDTFAAMFKRKLGQRAASGSASKQPTGGQST